MTRVRGYDPADWEELFRMCRTLFPDDTEENEAADLRAMLARDDTAVFVLERADGRLGGYVEAGTRPYADGCVTSPVGYVEAWFVDPDMRRNGHGRSLLAAAEEWARGMGYREMASDALLENRTSHRAHRRSGYEEVGRVVQFRKDLGAAAEG